jgi:prepilin-type N-terminal cleavage/methylation domain-containing protein/prepilin-type processing-associated H-X9-DG protein
MKGDPPGFSLPELLVAVVAITLLAGLTLPALQAARQSAAAGRSAGQLRQLVTANLAYAADHGTFAPSMDRANVNRWHGKRVGRGGSTFDPTQGYLSPYFGQSRSITLCPLLPAPALKGASFEQGSGGYGYNGAYIGGTPGESFLPARPASIQRPSSTLMFATTAFARTDGLQEYPFAEPYFAPAANGRPTFSLQPSLHFRANGHALVAWCDGHVTAEKPSRLGGPNYYGGNNLEQKIGWIGPEEENGYWNPHRSP